MVGSEAKDILYDDGGLKLVSSVKMKQDRMMMCSKSELRLFAAVVVDC